MKILIANWKAQNDSEKEALKLFRLYKNLSTKKKYITIIAPDILYLNTVTKSYRGKLIAFASQKMDTTPSNASLKAEQIKNAGAKFVFINHPDNKEDPKELPEKFFTAQKHGLVPILFTKEYSSDSKRFKELKQQIKQVLSKKKNNDFLLVYELGGINKNKHTKKDIEFMILYLRKLLAENIGEAAAKKIPILIGGAMDSVKIHALSDILTLNGFVIGRASTDKDELIKIYE